MRLIIIACAALALSACAGKPAAPLCLGVTKMTPQPATARYIATNDAPFARSVASNNRVIEAQCK